MRGDTYGYDDEYYEGGSFIGTILLMLIGGAIALAAFDAFGQIYAVKAGFAAVEPVALATKALEKVLPDYAQYGEYAHYAMGILGYPLGYVLLARPISRMIWPSVHWWVTGIIFGLVLAAFANFAIGYIVTGAVTMPDFTAGATQVSLVGHIIYGLVLAAVMRDGRYV